MEPNITVQTIEEYETSMFKDLLTCPFDVQPISKVENKYIGLLRAEIDTLKMKLSESEKKEKELAAKFKDKLLKIKTKQKTLIEKLHRGQNFEQHLKSEISRLESVVLSNVNKIKELESELLDKSKRLTEALSQIEKTNAEMAKQKALAMKLMSKQAANNTKLEKYKSFEANIEKEFRSYADVNHRLESELSDMRKKNLILENQLQMSAVEMDRLRKLNEQSHLQISEHKCEVEKLQSASKKEQKSEKWKAKYKTLCSDIMQINNKGEKKLLKTAEKTLIVLSDQQDSVLSKLRNLCAIYENRKSD